MFGPCVCAKSHIALALALVEVLDGGVRQLEAKVGTDEAEMVLGLKCGGEVWR